MTVVNQFLSPTDIDVIGDIAAFHEKFGQGYNGPPRLMTIGEHEFSHKFMAEEICELNKAYEARDWPRYVDAYHYIIYVALGRLYKMGVDFAEGWNRIHGKNMEKIPAAPGTFKIQKPPGWTEADLSDLTVPAGTEPQP